MLNIVNAYGCVLDIIRKKSRINKSQLIITQNPYYPNQRFFMQTKNDMNKTWVNFKL